MKWKLFLQNSNSGFSLIELLVASAVGLIITGMTLSVALPNQSLFHYDLNRTRLNQNLRGALDVIGINGREAGENLPESFPAVLVTDGGADPDELILRRNLLDEVLKVCQIVTAGSNDDVYFAIPGNTAGCTYGDQEQNYNAWKNYRNNNGGSVRAYIYDPTTEVGEFFDYVEEVDTGTSRIIKKGGGAWENTYDVGTAAVYILEEWHFRVDTESEDDPILEVVQNGLEDDPLKVVYGIEDFQIQVELDDGTIKDELLASDSWIAIKNIEATITGTETSRGEEITRTVSSKFFPRNILSN